MTISRSVLLLVATVCTSSALADVLDVDKNGFTSANELTIYGSRDEVWNAAINEVGQWWSPDHTLSGDATRLSITSTLQGCFCERLGADAGVVHLMVTMVSPGVVLRMTGGLGPLGLMGVNGNMTWEFEAVEEGTMVKFTYVVGGYSKGGLDTLAIPVDGVVGEALSRLKAYVEARESEPNSG